MTQAHTKRTQDNLALLEGHARPDRGRNAGLYRRFSAHIRPTRNRDRARCDDARAAAVHAAMWQGTCDAGQLMPDGLIDSARHGVRRALV